MDVWTDFFAGCCGGIAGTFFGHPIDTIKVRQQTHLHGHLTTRRCVQLALKNEGATGLFKGLSSPICTAALVNATFFGVYGGTVKLMLQVSEKPANSMPDYKIVTAAGMVAGTVQLLVCCPVDLVKIKLQTGSGAGNGPLPKTNGSLNTSPIASKPFKGPIDCLMTMYKTHGIRAWYKGLVPMFWRDGPSYGLYMFLYELILREGKKYSTGGWGDGLLALIAGGITGTVTWVAVLPIDVVKSRIQADCIVNPKYRGMLDCVRVSYKAEGLPVFFRGFLAIAFRAMIVNAATFFVYQSTLTHLTTQR
ncbi:mitochondrial basic amino acids transporter-like [Daphnia carinata]|uniref:mitochondrial basic amino acids transporter-like n=1 Tax=Daphnia carinata TaxID=120202 RepID=UPI00257E60E4|nr:mitochondrial basic amino acids transporter-like [Daphnia carinata]